MNWPFPRCPMPMFQSEAKSKKVILQERCCTKPRFAIEGVCKSEFFWFLTDIAAAMFANKNNNDTLLRKLNCLFVCLFVFKQDVVSTFNMTACHVVSNKEYRTRQSLWCFTWNFSFCVSFRRLKGRSHKFVPSRNRSYLQQHWTTLLFAKHKYNYLQISCYIYSLYNTLCN